MSENIKRVEIQWRPGHKDGPRFHACAAFSVRTPATSTTFATHHYGHGRAWGHYPPLVALLAALAAFEPEYRAAIKKATGEDRT